jgi:hypothetical protein
MTDGLQSGGTDRPMGLLRSSVFGSGPVVDHLWSACRRSVVVKRRHEHKRALRIQGGARKKTTIVSWVGVSVSHGERTT